MSDVVLVLCTAPESSARDLADRLLDERLVACVNLLGPMPSRYRWEGKIEEAQEMLLLMKSTSALAPRLRARVAELHSYDVPEVLEFAAAAGLEPYLAWVRESCRSPEAGE